MKMTREEKNWTLYDVGNSAFVMLVSTILPIYFNYLAQGAGLTDAQYLAYWGYAASITTIIYLFIAVFAIFLHTQLQFWILAVLVGMFQGGVQALSRSYFAKIIPAEQAGEYFGLMDICGKGAAFLGTTVVCVVTQLTGSMSRGVAMISLFFMVGIVFFNMAMKAGNEDAGQKQAEMSENENYKYPIDIV